MKEKIVQINMEYGIITYKTWLDKKNLEAFFREEFEVNKIFIAHETGTHKYDDPNTKPYKHTHVIVHIKRNKFNPATKCDFEDIHPNITVKKKSKMKPFQLLINYLANPAKEGRDMALDGLWKKVATNLATKIWDCKDVQEALTKCMDRPGDASGIIQCFNHKKEEEKKWDCPWPELRDWQADIMLKMEQGLKQGVLQHLYDDDGHAGKTKFFMWLYRCKHVAYIKCGNMSRSDMLNALKNLIKHGWNKRFLVMDFPRCEPPRKEDYAFAESVMDGIITTSKYDNGTVDLGDDTRVIMACNEKPMMHYLSKGRIHSTTLSGPY